MAGLSSTSLGLWLVGSPKGLGGLQETYSSVAKLVTARPLLALAAIFSWSVHVCDVDNAFLNAPLKEEIYLAQPEGANDGTGRVFGCSRHCTASSRLPRPGTRSWGGICCREGRGAATLMTPCSSRWDGDHFTFIPSWVDDLLLVGSGDEQVQEAKETLERGFKIKDLGEVSTYLGMQVSRNKSEGWLELSLQEVRQGVGREVRCELDGSSRVQTPDGTRRPP